MSLFDDAEEMPVRSREAFLIKTESMETVYDTDPRWLWALALAYNNDASVGGNRDRAKACLDTVIKNTERTKNTKVPCFLPWQLRVRLHLEDGEEEAAVGLCCRMVETSSRMALSAEGQSPLSAEIFEENVYFTACVVGYVSKLDSRKEIPFGFYEHRIKSAVDTYEPYGSLWKKYRAQTEHVAWKVLDGGGPDLREKGGRIVSEPLPGNAVLRDILVEYCGLPLTNESQRMRLRGSFEPQMPSPTGNGDEPASKHLAGSNP